MLVSPLRGIRNVWPLRRRARLAICCAVSGRTLVGMTVCILALMFITMADRKINKISQIERTKSLVLARCWVACGTYRRAVEMVRFGSHTKSTRQK